jgi:hypothetical protein
MYYIFFNLSATHVFILCDDEDLQFQFVLFYSHLELQEDFNYVPEFLSFYISTASLIFPSASTG